MRFRRIGATAILLVVLAWLLASLTNGNGSTVAAADERLASTQAQLARIVAKNQGEVQKLDHATNNGFTADVSAFAQNTEHMRELLRRLQEDTAALSAAREQTLASVDKEIGSVADSEARSRLQGIRDEASRYTQERLQTARIIELDLMGALNRANDVLHATKALNLAVSLRSGGDALFARAMETRAALEQYKQHTNSLLSRLQLPTPSGS